MQALDQRYYSPEEYLEFEVTSDERHEYINGNIIPMTGGTPEHNTIASNLNALLNFAMRRKDYRVFVADQRLWIPQKKIHTYPDVMVIKGNLQYQESRQDTLTNPTLIAEVLSKSTRSYDKDEKFAAYRTIPSFAEYLLIDQYQIQVEHFVRTEDGNWLFIEYSDIEQCVELATIPAQVSLLDMYDKVQILG